MTKMKKMQLEEKGFGTFGFFSFLVILAILAFGGWYVWSKNHNTAEEPPKTDSKVSKNTERKLNSRTPDETEKWITVTTQANAFSMKVPDGWRMTKYPNNFLGSVSVTYQQGNSAVITTSDSDYAGDSLRFRASISEITETALGPQWHSPQPGLTESSEDFSIGTLHGKRYKAVFSSDLHQTLYEYIFDLGSGKKLDIVYTVDQSSGDTDDVTTTEKAIKTIKFNQ